MKDGGLNRCLSNQSTKTFCHNSDMSQAADKERIIKFMEEKR